ncbi:MAG: class I SAM-dependent methyltransferase [Anaerohalosphaeraceae bacterium]
MKTCLKSATIVILATVVCMLFAAESETGTSQSSQGRQGFSQWFVELEQAYQNNNQEKIGELIQQVKQSPEAFQPAAGGPLPERQRGSGRRTGPSQGGSEYEKAPIPKNENEKTILAVLDDITANQRYLNVPQNDGRLLRLLAESMNAKQVVELGTSTGYSAIWLGMALQKTGGKLTTYEIDAERAAAARANFKKAGLADIITVVEGDAHERLNQFKDSVDIVFLDADKEGYIDYLNKLLPQLRPGGLIIAHNITPGSADPRYIEAITTNPDLETIVRSGVSLTLKKR